MDRPASYDQMNADELAQWEAHWDRVEVSAREQRRVAYAVAIAAAGNAHWAIPTAERRRINQFDLDALDANGEFAIVRSKFMAAAGTVGPGGPVIQPVPPGGNTDSLDPDKTFVPPVPQPGDQRDPGDEN